ncbi:hypothetical protein [Robertmurraya sp.]|uniref:hypothetical protein n=1 Tax=Robertmurraya sp. TaxID=2837525 RepID=UPI003704A80E
MIRHETEEEFFTRMKELANKLDNGESVQTVDSISFEDIEEYLLYSCGTFNTEDCISAEDIGKLIFKKGE